MGLSYHYCIIIIIHVNDMQNIYAAYKMHIHKLAIYVTNYVHVNIH